MGFLIALALSKSGADFPQTFAIDPDFHSIRAQWRKFADSFSDCRKIVLMDYNPPRFAEL
jgi:hypothetical protein